MNYRINIVEKLDDARERLKSSSYSCGRRYALVLAERNGGIQEEIDEWLSELNFTEFL